MPTYNRGWIIVRAIESVLGQSFKDFELIIVDDGSTDNTSKLNQSINDRRISFVQIDHRGVSAARNKAISLAGGDLIAYLDTDNVWHADFLEVMILELKRPYVLGYCSENMFLLAGKNPGADIIGRKVRNVDYNPVKLAKTNYIDINSVLHDKKLFAEIGTFDEGLQSLEDWDFFIRIALKYPFLLKHIDQVLCDYYYFLNNVTTTVTNRVLSDKDMFAYFQISDFQGDEKKITDKIKNYLADRLVNQTLDKTARASTG